MPWERGVVPVKMEAVVKEEPVEQAEEAPV